MTLDESFASVLAAAQAAQAWALTALYRDLNPALVAYLRAQDPTDGDDLASEVWIDVASALPRFEGNEAAFRRWVFTIARRRLIDLRRSAARRRSTTVAPDDLLWMAASDSPDGEVLELEATGAALALIRTLPPDQAEVVLLRVVAGLDAAEVALITGKRPGTVRVLQHRALKRLARALQERVVTR